MPRAQLPTRIASSYASALIKALRSVTSEAVEKLTPALKEAAATPARVAQDAATPKDVEEIIDSLREQWADKWPREKIAKLADGYGDQVSVYQATQLNRQLKGAIGSALSTDVVGDEPWLAKSAADFTRENVALIQSVQRRYFDEIETLVARGLADGERWENLVEQISERGKVSESRAKLIARDQAGKFYGDLNRVRQTDLGITRFIWRDVGDNRVREEHALLNGRSFTWADAPDGGPGEAINCRCYAEPDLESALGE